MRKKLFEPIFLHHRKNSFCSQRIVKFFPRRLRKQQMKQLSLFLKVFPILFFVFSHNFSVGQVPNTALNNGRIFIGLEPHNIIHLKKIGIKCGTSLKGHFVKTIEGSSKELECFQAKWEELNSTKSIKDESILGNDFPLFVEKSQPGLNHYKEEAYFLAKKDFNLPSFWKKNPKMDGRGVIVGVIDDGISPHAQGFKKTTTGQRKVIGHYSNSTGLRFTLKLLNFHEESELIEENNVARYWKGFIDEEKHLLSYPHLFTDLNRNKTKDKIKVWVFEKDNKSLKICIDTNINQKREEDECFTPFNETGGYGFWDKNKQVALLAEFDPKTNILTVNEGEDLGDSHGEGVASVMAGHKIAGRFDGVAPGSQIIDYDLGEPSHDRSESFYTFSTFLKALELLGEKGAHVVNISYSLYFLSEENQLFMQEALDKLIKKYNFVLCFSAGNNGPGLKSLNRRNLYSPNSLVVGAFAGKDLYERIHGVGGLPKQGILPYYSSRGPGPSGGLGPSLISPLASLTYSTGDRGLRAFSGTSSASPAIGGLTAVLISALKQLNLPIEVKSVVEALKLSGTPLKKTPFLAQGYGLPKIEKAIQIYKRFLNGELFNDIKHNLRAPDGSIKKGLLLKTSEIKSIFIESRVFFKGFLGQTVDESRKSEILVPIKIEYSHPWIEGPKRSFISSGRSFISIGINLEKLLNDFKNSTENLGNSELFGEVKILEEMTGQTLKIIPITLIHDVPLTDKMKWNIKLRAEEGKRVHFYIPPSVKALKIKTEADQGFPGRIGLKLYGPGGVKSRSQYIKEDTHLVFTTPKGGHYQLGVFRLKGTSRPSKIKIQIKPLKVELNSKALIKGKEQVFLSSLNKETIRGDILILPKKELIKEKYVFFKGDNELTLSVPFQFEKKGDYTIGLKPLYPEEWSYQRESCLHLFKNEEEKVLLTKWGKIFSNLKLNEKEIEHKVSAKVLEKASSIHFHCRFFDSFKKTNYETPFIMSLNFQKEEAQLSAPVSLKRGYNKINFEKGFFKNWNNSSGAGIFLKIKDSIGESIFLGNLPIIVN